MVLTILPQSRQNIIANVIIFQFEKMMTISL